MSVARRVGALAIAAALVSAFTIVTTPSATAEVTTAKLRVAHFSPDTPGVDVYLDGKRAVGNMGFQTVTDYLTVPGGAHEYAIRPSGAPASSPAVLAGKATLAGGDAYTVAGLGMRAQLHIGVFVDNLSAPPAGKANVRLVNALIGVPAVTMTMGGQTAIANTQFGAASSYEPVTAGRYDVGLNDGSSKPVYGPASLEFGPRHHVHTRRGRRR
jgi:hypothetical protein